MKQNNVAIIGARKGSKRLPYKNLLPLGDRPLIEWSIRAAIESKRFSKVLVSTDDEEIAQISKAAGANVPFMRPAEISNDTSPSIDFILHALDWLGNNDTAPELVTLLQPTSPLRTAEDIVAAEALFKSSNARSVVSVTQCDHPPQWSTVLGPQGEIDHLIKSLNGERSQDLPPHYRINGAIYMSYAEDVLKSRRLLSQDRCYALVMPKERSVDIDEMLDFKIAEALIAKGDIND